MVPRTIKYSVNDRVPCFEGGAVNGSRIMNESSKNSMFFVNGGLLPK